MSGSQLGVARVGSIAAIAGAVLLLVGTYLHPLGADPNVPVAAFTEYAADRHWVASHLMQLGSITSLLFGVLEGEVLSPHATF